jgi:NAD(P)-dependent dehydrogenase (short-subunit alcohol dehydrogenase family)
VAIVTGGSTALSREVVRALADQGDAIAVVYLDDQSSAEATVEELLDSGGTAVAIRADLADELDVARIFTETIVMFGDVDLVVHTTGHEASVFYDEASRCLRRGSAIVSVSPQHVAPGVAERLRERDITLDGDRDLTELLAVVERWRRRRSAPRWP